MVLFLHNRYRTTGGEERVVGDLLWLVREQLGEPAQLLARDSAAISGVRAAAGLLRGGLSAADVERSVRAGGARVVHAHNLLPALGWRALAAARAAGARVVLHLHQYRLVCATGVCYTRGAQCTRCHARNTLPGVRLNCRGSLPEALAYGLALSLWQRRLIDQADAVIVPSALRARAPARARARRCRGSAWSCSRRPCARSPRKLATRHRTPSRPRGATRRRPHRPTRWSCRACRRRRESTWRSRPAAWRASRS